MSECVCVRKLEGIRNFTEERLSKMCVTCLGTCQSLSRVCVYLCERERETSKASSVTKPEAFQGISGLAFASSDFYLQRLNPLSSGASFENKNSITKEVELT